jgi:hypothetical protein
MWAPVGHVSIGSQTQAAFTTGTSSLQVVADVSPSWSELTIICLAHGTRDRVLTGPSGMCAAGTAL